MRSVAESESEAQGAQQRMSLPELRGLAAQCRGCTGSTARRSVRSTAQHSVAHLLGRAVAGVQNRLQRLVVGAGAQAGRGAQVNQAEAAAAGQGSRHRALQ